MTELRVVSRRPQSSSCRARKLPRMMQRRGESCCLVGLICMIIVSSANAALSCTSGSYYSGITLECELCPAGRFGSSSGLTSPFCSGECPLGHYCPPGSNFPQKCPAGFYGSEAGLVDDSCSGPCQQGYWCPEGSLSPRARLCGGRDYYCPEGSAQRLKADAGYSTISLDEASSSSSSSPLIIRHTIDNETRRIAQVLCKLGYFCINGVATKCPVGSSAGLSNPQCQRACPIGQYCPEGSAFPLPCPAGTYSNMTGQASCVDCPPGNYCEAGSASPIPCPAGTYGETAGLQTPHCHPACHDDDNNNEATLPLLPQQPCFYNLCPAGSYCPRGTIKPIVCGSEIYYCPLGSYKPRVASSGFCTIGNASVICSYQSITDSTSRTGQQPCEPGTYCRSGRRVPCPAGFYGAENGLSNATCSGQCAAGFYCPPQSIKATQYPCGSVDQYCPRGSKAPLPVFEGYYSINGGPSTRSAQILCPIGHYCTGGLKFKCPLGRFGNATGLSTRECSGTCLPGYYCPAASTQATEMACAGGRFSTGGAGDATCEGLCEAGFVCPSGQSHNPREEECGGEEWYCPLGSGHKRNVTAGAYALDGDSMTRSSQAICLNQTLPGANELSNNCPSNTQ